MNKIRFLKAVDRVVGSALSSIIVSILRLIGRESLSHGTLGKILVIRPGGIGDAVLLLPALKKISEQIRELCPGAQIDILCEKRNHGIFQLSGDINRIYLYDRGIGLIKCLRNSYDAVVDTEQWHRLSAVIAYLTRARVRVGFNTNERGGLFTHMIPYSHDDYEGKSFFNLIAPLIGVKPFDGVPDVFISGGAFIDSGHIEIFKTGKTIAIAPGASVKERSWGGDNFGLTAQRLSELGFNIVIIGSQADKSDAVTIKDYCTGAVDFTGTTSLKDTAPLLKSVSALVCADSGIMHIAYALGTPTVSLFGSGIEKKWAPQGKSHRVINKHLPCSPCTKFGYTPPCASVKCLTQITVDEVVGEVVDLLRIVSCLAPC
ncbi:glycosyltransferase family 9 protein [Candidatus Magnetominusculus xianensis]|nr:glycosyltransferase family 9 protein [Candidatus Magnetominusculus xianensis]MBF0404648.1 glycosyltransferase family 9 protein [Nitrospirota bacterium]